MGDSLGCLRGEEDKEEYGGVDEWMGLETDGGSTSESESSVLAVSLAVLCMSKVQLASGVSKETLDCFCLSSLLSDKGDDEDDNNESSGSVLS
jgi:hypothetical protein